MNKAIYAAALFVGMSLSFSMGYWYQGYKIYHGLLVGYEQMMPPINKDK